MIKLHQFPKSKHTINYSPYCLKVDTYLRMAEVPFEVVEEQDPRKAPKGKFPFINDEGKTIADSTFIVEYLKNKFGDKLDASLTPLEKAQSVAFKRMMEEGLIYNLMYSRWIDNWVSVEKIFFGSMPLPLKLFVPKLIQKKMKNSIVAQGTGRHSREEVYELAKMDIKALADFLGDKPYFFGEKATSLDATAFGFLNNLVNDLIDSPLKIYALSFPNLIAYTERVRTRYFE